MASPAILQFDSLLEPIPGGNPAGSSLPFEIRQQLEEDRKEENPEDYAPDDPQRPEKFKKADWPDIIKVAKETLTRKSKDLLLAARLLEALVKQHGFAGLRDGLRLLRLLVEQCWDRLNPPFEADDVEVRLGPFLWIDDPDRGARFPVTVRMVPLYTGEAGRYGWLAWRQAQEAKGPVTREEFEKAVAATPLEQCQQSDEELAQSLDELTKLTEALNARLGSAAPALISIRQAIEDCKRLSQHMLLRKVPVSEAASAQGPSAAGGAERPAGSRAEAYRQLEQAANLLQQLEPHSPIPYLVRRAVELGALPFPMLLRELVRDQNIVKELNREFGIKEPAEPH